MPKLMRTIINGRPATIAYLTALDGDITDSETAKAARISYDDGEVGLYLIEEEKDVDAPQPKGADASQESRE